MTTRTNTATATTNTVIQAIENKRQAFRSLIEVIKHETAEANRCRKEGDEHRKEIALKALRGLMPHV